jgi:hypothetical protein
VSRVSGLQLLKNRVPSERAGDRLIAEEIAALLGQREPATDGHLCPHGRPFRGR